MSASACRPPTAKPGTSQHEVGLAIDFSNCSSRSSACFQWLAGNAARFGFHNLPVEPWHWSTTGR
jgi:LAS superfamily LD-carboxypeptidase LdcB